MRELKLRTEIEHDDDARAKDLAKPYVDLFIADCGNLPRDQFEAHVNWACDQAVRHYPEVPEPEVWAFWVITVPALTMKAYDLLHAGAAGGG